MSAAELSRDRVEERLGALDAAYASFSVSQTTLSVSPAAYERVRERCRDGQTEAYVRVHDEDGDVLLVEADGEWTVPHATPGTDEGIERGTCAALAEATGVECRITDLERVTILGVCDEEAPERDAVYRLVPVFDAERTGGAPTEGVAWHATVPDGARPAY